MEVVADYLEKSVILVAQAMNAVCCPRRRAILRELLGDDTKATTWLHTNYETELKENKNDLFGEVLKAKWSSDAKAKNQSLKQFLSPPQATNRKPF